MSRSKQYFDYVKIQLASPETIKFWGERKLGNGVVVGKISEGETLNYRTLKPEMDGLFCEKIFGPARNWQCHCGKYKHMQEAGIVCEKCWVIVTRSLLRRYRMGYISLATKVVHMWYLKSRPSFLSLFLDESKRTVEAIIYFSTYIIVNPKLYAYGRVLNHEYWQLRSNEIFFYDPSIKRSIARPFIKALYGLEPLRIDKEVQTGGDALFSILKNYNLNEEIVSLYRELSYMEQVGEISIKWKKNRISELKLFKFVLKKILLLWSNVSRRSVLKRVKLEPYGFSIPSFGLKPTKKYFGGIWKIPNENEEEEWGYRYRERSTQRTKPKRKTVRERILWLCRRLRLIHYFVATGTKPEWMILSVLPVIPPALRPIVHLGSNRFVSSDLNDLYRLIIRRNNRFFYWQEILAPSVILYQEKRLIQRAVDALIDNSRSPHEKVRSANKKKLLKSLSDVLRGKRGRFRQNLLGKRVDYSGRSVIVVGPELKLYQCGLPVGMAIELFFPLLLYKLICNKMVNNIDAARKLLYKNNAFIKHLLEEIITDRAVLLNRAPTLHRLGIQAFIPVLIEGNAIQLHPLVCSAFNADFDGDQMAVHIPLSARAQHEVQTTMLASYNILSPATGEPIITPTQDIVLGCYYLTVGDSKALDKVNKSLIYNSCLDVLLAYRYRLTSLHSYIWVCVNYGVKDSIIETELLKFRFHGLNAFTKIYKNRRIRENLNITFYIQYIHTTTGRVLFNQFMQNALGQ
uniref:DNA-directed RNA polymerase subunit n=1 Tax=Gloeochaete wittrockiana TaxID=38269 RepID=A0A3G1IVV4_9EUKA|nr:RNA polymerase beta' subunit [Gloeochaete wittrockiana]ASQ40186.1 RNA polymerase beta' subunit [Gloeochaete wittrockiana]